MSDKVQAWSEIVKIPTYKIGIPDKNLMFLEKWVYQGSSGAVYRHPVIDRVFDEKRGQRLHRAISRKPVSQDDDPARVRRVYCFLTS